MLLTVLTLLLSSAPLAAQMGGGLMPTKFGARGFMGPPAFLEQLFPPHLVMRYQEDIGLTDEQRTAISQAMGDTQKTLVDLQWHSESESAKLEKLLGSTSVDEKAALAQADKVMAIETQMKRTHLGLLLHIKNLLTAAQQTKLRSLRPKGANSAMPMPPPGE